MAFVAKENLLAVLQDFKGHVNTLISDAKPTNVSELTNDSKYQTADDVAATVASTLSDAKSYTDEAVGAVAQFNIEKVDALPEVGTAKEKTVYLVPIEGSTPDDNKYEEYLVINGAWEIIGTTKTDLSDYYDKETIDQKISGATPEAMTEEEVVQFNSDLWA